MTSGRLINNISIAVAITEYLQYFLELSLTSFVQENLYQMEPESPHGNGHSNGAFAKLLSLNSCWTCCCQGSHVTSQAGAYILQWKYLDSGRGSFDLRSAHKSKIMYYTEVLQSDKFKYDSFVTSIVCSRLSWMLVDVYSSCVHVCISKQLELLCCRGSMSSLLSCQSGFSQLSLTSNSAQSSAMPSLWPSWWTAVIVYHCCFYLHVLHVLLTVLQGMVD